MARIRDRADALNACLRHAAVALSRAGGIEWSMFILLHGPDEFSAHEELDRLRMTRGYEFNQETFDGAGTELATIRTTCETLPFLSERRLVVVRGLPKRTRARAGEEEEDGEHAETPAPAVKGGRGKKAKAGAGEGPKAFIAGLADYASHVPETTDLVVLVDELMDAAHPLAQVARANGRAQAFATPRGPQLDAWVARRARTCGVGLASEAARLLVEVVGDNLRLLAGEIEKLSTYVGSGGTIGAEDVRRLTPMARELRAFDLTDALVRRERARALDLLHELLESGSAPQLIIGMVAHQTRTLMRVKALADRGARAPQIAQTTGMVPFVVEKSLGLARHFSMAQLEAAHRALLNVDTALKLSRMTPEMALDLLVVEFGAAQR
ncbi:MAG: DNA polymerase III subunit delta [Ktedonobacterales bacterium]|nr:DNA polymerase III subunit delta [Ktedonobacterales bacterium]